MKIVFGIFGFIALLFGVVGSVIASIRLSQYGMDEWPGLIGGLVLIGVGVGLLLLAKKK